MRTLDTRRTAEPDAPVGGQARDTAGAVAGHGAPPFVAVAVGVTALLAVLLVAFAWPATSIAPRGLPVAVAGPAPAAGAMGERLADFAGPDAFDITVVADRAAAEAAVRDRQVYGALVLGPQGGEMLTASAASPAVASLLGRVAASVPAEAGGPLAVTDVVALPGADPRGAGLASVVLPLALGGMAAGAGAALAVVGMRRRIATVALVAVAGGAVTGAVLDPWLGVFPGAFWLVSGVVALGVAAIGYALVGLHRVLGRAGLAVGALLVMVLGNPLSGATSAPELLPAPWGALGQLLPPGAAASLLRSVSYFENAAAGAPLLILTLWALVGLGLAVVPQRAMSATVAPVARTRSAGERPRSRPRRPPET